MNRFLYKVFMWMFVGLMITFATGYYVSTNENMLYNIFSGGTWLILTIVEIVLVIVLSARVKKMNPMTAKILFCLYAFVTGLTFSSIFIEYKLQSVIFVFLVTAIIFLVFALIGYFTKLPLSKLSTYLMMALIGVIICSIVNMFIGSNIFDTIISCVAVVVFIGMTAYDVYIMKFYEGNNDNYAIVGALQLYLDFINLFVYLLKFFGKSDD